MPRLLGRLVDELDAVVPAMGEWDGIHLLGFNV
jgi:hypothetical protein